MLENLGLVVALRRRPATVYVLDASGDQRNSFSTLAQAIAMARIDSGVEVEDLDLTPLECDDSGFSASASAHSSSRPSASATRRPASSRSGVRSLAVTSAPARAAGIAALPVPAATSSTRAPGPIPHACTSRGPIGSRNVSTIRG